MNSGNRVDELCLAFDEQADYCEALGSALTAWVCRQVAHEMNWKTPLGQHLLQWPGDFRSFADNVPLRLCGALNWLALGKHDAALNRLYPPCTSFSVVDRSLLWETIKNAMETHIEAIKSFMQNAPQTNELRRSIALIPCYHKIAREFGLPLAIFELGASAGLNLVAHRYHFLGGEHSWGDPESAIQLTPEWQGKAPRSLENLEVASIAGCDLAPIDVRDMDQLERALSYIWPDQRERVALTRAGYRMLADEPDCMVEKADAIDWLEVKLKDTAPDIGVARVFQHTIAWQYFPQSAKERGEKLFAEYGRVATVSAPLARISMESDGNPEGALLQLTLWPEGKRVDLARVDFHGCWIRWF